MPRTHSSLVRTTVCTVLLLAMMAGLTGCKDLSLHGNYSGAHQDTTLELKLKADGTAEWLVDGAPTPCTWEQREDRIWLHTKSGGLLTGTVEEEGTRIVLELPGVGTIPLTRTSG